MKKLVAILVCSTMASTSLFGMKPGPQIEEPDDVVSVSSSTAVALRGVSSPSFTELTEADQATLARNHEKAFQLLVGTAHSAISLLGQTHQISYFDGLSFLGTWVNSALSKETPKNTLSEMRPSGMPGIGTGSTKIYIGNELRDTYVAASRVNTSPDTEQERATRVRVVSSMARKLADTSSHWPEVTQKWPQFAQDWNLFADFMEMALNNPLPLDVTKRFLEQPTFDPESKMVSALKTSYGQTATLVGAPRLGTPTSFPVRTPALELLEDGAGSSSSAGGSANSLSPETLDGILATFRTQLLQETAEQTRQDFVSLAKDLQGRLNATFEEWMKAALSKTAQ